MRWFGSSWGAPINGVVAQCETPIGYYCCYCGRQFEIGDQGFELPLTSFKGELEPFVYYHRDCLLRDVGMAPKDKRERTDKHRPQPHREL